MLQKKSFFRRAYPRFTLVLSHSVQAPFTNQPSSSACLLSPSVFPLGAAQMAVQLETNINSCKKITLVHMKPPRRPETWRTFTNTQSTYSHTNATPAAPRLHSSSSFIQGSYGCLKSLKVLEFPRSEKCFDFSLSA